MTLMIHPDAARSPFVPDDPSFDVISASIRLGHKYQISKLVEHSVNYLKMYYTEHYGVFRKRGHPYWPPAFREEHAIGVINLARLTGEHSMLPVAFLICCTLDKDKVRGFQREDGSWERLHLDDIALCFEARGNLVARRAAATVHMLYTTADDQCEDPDLCQEKFHELLGTLTTQELSISDPFRSVFEAYKKGLETSLCSECFSLREAHDNVQLSGIWVEFPCFFGLDAGALVTMVPTVEGLVW